MLKGLRKFLKNTTFDQRVKFIFSWVASRYSRAGSSSIFPKSAKQHWYGLIKRQILIINDWPTKEIVKRNGLSKHENYKGNSQSELKNCQVDVFPKWKSSQVDVVSERKNREKFRRPKQNSPGIGSTNPRKEFENGGHCMIIKIRYDILTYLNIKTIS